MPCVGFRNHLQSDLEGGFTIVEVMVAMIMLVGGVLALLALVENGLASTSRTTAREQGTNLARDLVERSRQVPYASTTTSLAPATLAAALPELPAVTGSTFVVNRRNVAYTVTVTACSIDDPADGAGVGDVTFCAAPSSTTGPGSPLVGSGLASGPNILGLPVFPVGGSLINTVCNAVGTNSAILNTVSSIGTNLLALQGDGAQLSICPNPSAGTIAFDTSPDDMRRIRLDVAWTRGGRTGSVSQTTVLTKPA